MVVAQTGKTDQFIIINDPGPKSCLDSIISIDVRSSSGLPVKVEIISGPGTIKDHIITLSAINLANGKTHTSILLKASQQGNESVNPSPDEFKILNIQTDIWKNYSSNESFVSVDTSICEGEDFTLNVASVPGITYIWDTPGSIKVNHSKINYINSTISLSGIYSLKVQQGKCTFFNATWYITVHPNPKISFTSLPKILKKKETPFTISTQPPGGLMSINNEIIDYNMAIIEKTGHYSLKYTFADRFSCTSTIEDSITILKEPSLKIFTLITPNGDSYNDTFFVKDLEEYPDNDLTITDSWGNTVYQSTNYKNSWAPTQLSKGEYFYHLIVRPINKTFTGGFLIIP